MLAGYGGRWRFQADFSGHFKFATVWRIPPYGESLADFGGVCQIVADCGGVREIWKFGFFVRTPPLSAIVRRTPPQSATQLYSEILVDFGGLWRSPPENNKTPESGRLWRSKIQIF